MKQRLQYLVGMAASLAVSCLAAGCFTPRYNEELDPKLVSTQEDAAPTAQQDEDTLFFVAFSGGGTRAAAMSWAVLEQLRKIPYHYKEPDGKLVESTLADEIDYVSGISGGSFAAAAWCLFHHDSKAMEGFRRNFIERNIQGALLQDILWPPWRGLKLLSSRYDRIHIAAELYDREVFGRKTFGDLPSHPSLWVNATNLSLGNRFTFTPQDFAYMGSDLSKYPIGYACAASSAFPVLLSPMTLINYGKELDLGDEARGDLSYINQRDNARDNLDVEADLYVRMRDFYNDKRNKYVHLADGGLVDNQGLQAILNELSTDGLIYTRLNRKDRPLKRLIVLNVNAGVVGEDLSSEKESAPGIVSVLGYTTVLSMDLLSSKRWAQISTAFDDLGKVADELGDSTASLSKVGEPYAIELNFRNLTDECEKAKAWALPTSFALDRKQLALIEKSVAKLVATHPAIRRLEESLRASCVEAGCKHAPTPDL